MKRAVAKSVLLGLPLSALVDIFLGIILPDHMTRSAFVVVASVLTVAILLVTFGTVTKNRWGINRGPVNCPACGSLVAQAGQPTPLRQVLWGGRACGRRGCQMDKWGRLIALTH